MACKLYYQYGTTSFQLGTFQNKAKAEFFWAAIRAALEARLGSDLKPIYVETGKGRGK